MTRHNRLAHAKGKPFPCTLCDKSFAFKYKLLNHVNTFHKQVKPLKKFCCTLCDKSFKSRYDLTLHLEGVHYLYKLKAFSCTLCEKSFSHKQTLDMHYGVHNISKPYSCILCDQSFSSELSLNRHVTMLHNLIDCTICGKSLGSNLDLTLHINEVHHKLFKDFSCALCKKSFTKQEQLTEHKAAVHPKFSTCTFCSKVFSSEHYLKHFAVKHEKLNPIVHQESKAIDQCTFDCRFCDITLMSHEDLEKHEKFCEKLTKEEEASLQFMVTNKTIKQEGNGKSPETFNTVTVKKYYSKEEFKQHKCKKIH